MTCYTDRNFKVSHQCEFVCDELNVKKYKKKRFVTLVAAVRFLASVSSFVKIQALSGDERFVALVATVRFLPGVSSLVNNQAPRGDE